MSCHIIHFYANLQLHDVYYKQSKISTQYQSKLNGKNKAAEIYYYTCKVTQVYVFIYPAMLWYTVSSKDVQNNPHNTSKQFHNTLTQHKMSIIWHDEQNFNLEFNTHSLDLITTWKFRVQKVKVKVKSRSCNLKHSI